MCEYTINFHVRDKKNCPLKIKFISFYRYTAPPRRAAPPPPTLAHKHLRQVIPTKVAVIEYRICVQCMANALVFFSLIVFVYSSNSYHHFS